MVELRFIVFYSREERRRWRQGPRCLRCLKLRMVGGLGGLMMTPRRSSGCGACIPELTTRRHHGTLLCLSSRAKASTLQGRDRRFTVGSAFHMSFRGLPSLLATQQKWYNHVQQVAQSLIPHNYRQYRCTSKLYFYLNKFWYLQYIPISFTETGSARSCHSQQFEKNLLRKVPGNYYNKPPTYSSPSALPTIQQTGWFVQVSSDVVAFCLRMIRTGSRFSLVGGG